MYDWSDRDTERFGVMLPLSAHETVARNALSSLRQPNLVGKRVISQRTVKTELTSKVAEDQFLGNGSPNCRKYSKNL
jgi:hypothetical protein